MEVQPVELLSENVSRKRIQKKNEIIDRLLQKLQTENINDLSLNKLAKEMGYSPAALYRYFPSWGSLLAEVLKRIIANIDDLTEKKLLWAENYILKDKLSRKEAVILKLHTLVDCYLDFGEAYPQQLSLINHLMSDNRILVNDDEAQLVLADGWQIFIRLASLIDEGVSLNLFVESDSLERSLSLWGSLQGLLQSQKMSRFMSAAPDTSRICHDLTAALLVSWGAKAKQCRLARHSLKTHKTVFPTKSG